MFEIVVGQDSATVRVRTLKNSYIRIRLHHCVLIVRRDGHRAFSVSVEEVVDLRVV